MCETRNFYLWLLQIVGLLGLIALILWLSLRPKTATVTVVELTIPPIGDSSSATDGGNGTLLYALEVENPNKDSSIDFDDVVLTFLFGQDTAATDTILSFDLDKDKKQEIRGQNVNVNARSWKALRTAVSKNGTALLKVDFSTKFRYKTIGIKSKHRGAKWQGDVQLGKDGKISGKKKRIKLKHTSKKWRVKASHSKLNNMIN